MRYLRVEHLLALLFAVSWVLPMNSAIAQRTKSDRIVFLRLKLKHDSVAVLRATVRPGTLKSPRAALAGEGLAYDVVSSDGRVLWHGLIDNPLVRRYEYEDPAEAGRLKSGMIVSDEAEFTIRIPLREGMQLLRMEMIARNPKGGTRGAMRTPLGPVTIPPVEEWK